MIAVALTGGKSEIFLATQSGQAIRFKEEDVRPMGRQAYGVKGIELSKKDLVVGQFNGGKMKVYRNLGGGKLAEGEWLEADGEIAEVPGVW